MEKRDGEWRIAARKCVPDWGGQPVETQISPEARAMLAQSGTVARDASDCSYERPLTIPEERIGINVDILAGACRHAAHEALSPARSRIARSSGDGGSIDPHARPGRGPGENPRRPAPPAPPDTPQP